MRRPVSTPARAPRGADQRARARLVGALGCSIVVHALITTGVPSGHRALSRGDAALTSRGALEVVLAEVTPELPRVAGPEEAEVRTATAAPTRAGQKKPPVPRPAPVSAEGAPREASAGPARIPDPAYYGARQLDVYPVLASTLRLTDPDGGRTPAGVGRVLLLVLIDAEGRVNEVSVIEAEPPGVFEEHTRATFQAARFIPALKDGRPVKSRLLVEVDYSDSKKR